MDFYRNSKTSMKLMIGFGLMAGLMCVLGYFGVRSMSELNDATSELYQTHAVGLAHLKEANLHLSVTGRALRNLILARNKADGEKWLDQLRNERAAFATEFAAFEHLAVVPLVKERAAVAKQDCEKLWAAQDKVIAAVEAHQQERAIDQLTELAKLNAVVDQSFAELSQAKTDAMKASANHAEATFQSGRQLSITLIGVAVVGALLLGFFIARMISAPLAQAVEVLAASAKSDFSKRLDVNTRDEVGEMARSLNHAMDNTQRAVKETSSVLALMAGGDLTARMEGAYEGDFALIKESLNLAAAKLKDAMTEVRDAAAHVAGTARTLSSASEEMASGAQEQASSLEETASSLEEITSTVKQNADNARQASQLAAGSRDAAEKGGSVVRAAVTAMSEINASSTRIAEIITTIDEIAFQTNLLALNAAVEAARAGEQGRGFAVVAAEVRNLAQRSATASKEIKALIQDSVRKVENGSDLVNRSGQTLEEIVQSVKRVTDIVAEIAAASQEQSTGIEQVNKATMQMDQVTQSNAAQTEEMSSTAQGLSASAEQLQGMVGRFQLGDEGKIQKAPRVEATRNRARRPSVYRRPAAHDDVLREEASLAGLARHTGVTDANSFEEF